MSDLLSNGVSGLLAFQRALDTTAHNIANVGTEGYSRQRVEFGARVPTLFGDNYLGNGVQIDSVRRMYDELTAQQARSASSSFQRFDTYAAQAERVNNLFANTDHRALRHLAEVCGRPAGTWRATRLRRHRARCC